MGRGSGRLHDVTLGPRARIGLLYPETGLLDEEFWAFSPQGVALFVARTQLEGEASVETLTEMANHPHVDRAAAGFARIDVDVLAYACTAAGFIRGIGLDAELNDRLSLAARAPATNTVTASVRAMRRLGLRRVSVATPYIGEIDDRLASFLGDSGFEILARRSLGLRGAAISLVPLEEVRELVRSVDRPEADGVYVACTGLRTYELIDDLEEELGKPVVSANQATIWDALRLVGVTHGEGVGSLMRASSAAEVAS